VRIFVVIIVSAICTMCLFALGFGAGAIAARNYLMAQVKCQSGEKNVP